MNITAATSDAFNGVGQFIDIGAGAHCIDLDFGGDQNMTVGGPSSAVALAGRIIQIGSYGCPRLELGGEDTVVTCPAIDRRLGALTARCDELEEANRKSSEVLEKLYYAPGGPGAADARAHFLGLSDY